MYTRNLGELDNRNQKDEITPLSPALVMRVNELGFEIVLVIQVRVEAQV